LLLLVTDLDGTVFGPNQPISTETKAAAALLRENDIGLTAATGRNEWEARELVEQMGITLPVILASGAQIYDFRAERLLYGKEFCRQTLLAFLEGLPGAGGLRIHWFDGTGWQSGSFREFQALGRAAVVQRVFLEDPGSSLDLADGEDHPYWVFRQGNLVELTPKEVHKGEGLMELCRLLGIDPREVTAVGDGANDLELLQTAGVGFAVAGGHVSLREAADAVTVSMEEHPLLKIAQWMVGRTPWERIVMRA